MRTMLVVVVTALATACGGSGRTGLRTDGGNEAPDLTLRGGDMTFVPSNTDGSTDVCGEFGCYTVYAHSDHVLYKLDLKNKLLVTIGPFAAPLVMGAEDAITDLAVAPDDTVYAISKTNLYTVNPASGHVTLLAPVTACGGYAVALTFAVDGTLYAGDHKGAFCKIDLTTMPAKAVALAGAGGGYGFAGDLVSVADGTMYATVYSIANSASESNNTLAKVNPATGAVTPIGPTGFPRLFGIAFEQGQVFGFTGDGTGDVVTIDPKTGKGALYGTFNDSSTNKPITFGGAGVNAKVPTTVM